MWQFSGLKSRDCDIIELGEIKMERVCVKCQKPSENGLPLCGPCRESLKDFHELAKYLNSFTGDKDDLLWIIGSEISSRQAFIIGQCKVEPDNAAGVINLVPIEPSSGTVRSKPWLREKFEHIKQTIDEISKLMRARKIAVQHYGVV